MVALFSPLSESQYQRLESLAFVFGLIALGGGLLCRYLQTHVGIVTCAACLFMMCCLGSYAKRREERGVWMLAMLFGGGGAAFYLFALAMHLRDLLQGRSSGSPWIALDFAIAGTILVIAIRASWTVVKHNRGISRSPTE